MRLQNWLVPLVLLLFLLPMFPGCIEKPLEPVLPNTDLQMSVPLVNRTFDLRKMRSTDLALRGDGTFFFDTTLQQTPQGISELTVSPQSTEQSYAIGEFTVPGLPSQNSQIGISALGIPPGPAPLVPPATYSIPPSGQVDMSATVEFIHAKAGTLTLTVTNNMPIPIEFPDPIEIQNDVSGDTSAIAAFDLSGPALTQGQSRTANYSFTGAGKMIRSQFRIGSIRMQTPGSGGAPVNFSSTDNIAFSFSSTGITTDSSRIVFQDLELASIKDSTLVIDDSVLVKNAHLKSGVLEFFFDNQLDASARAILYINNFRNVTTGVADSLIFIIPAKSQLTHDIEMSSLNIGDDISTIGSKVTFSAGIKTINTAGQHRTVTANDYFSVRLGAKAGIPWAIESVEGRIKPTIIPVYSASGGFDLGEASKLDAAVIFDSASIALNLGLSGGYITDYNLQVLGKNTASGIQRTLVVPPPNGSPQTRFDPKLGIQSIVLDNATGLSNFLSTFFPTNPPDSFIVSGSVTLNPPDVFGTPEGLATIRDTAKLYTSVQTYFPIRLGIGGTVPGVGALVVDTVSLADNKDFPRDFASQTRTATMFFQITNGFPFKISFAAYLLGPVKDPFGNIIRRDTLVRILNKDQAVINAAQIDGRGFTVPGGAATSTFAVTLTGDELLKFDDAETLWFRAEIETSGGGAQPVSVRQNDFLTVRASANLVYIVTSRSK